MRSREAHRLLRALHRLGWPHVYENVVSDNAGSGCVRSDRSRPTADAGGCPWVVRCRTVAKYASRQRCHLVDRFASKTTSATNSIPSERTPPDLRGVHGARIRICCGGEQQSSGPHAVAEGQVDDGTRAEISSARFDRNLFATVDSSAVLCTCRTEIRRSGDRASIMYRLLSIMYRLVRRSSDDTVLSLNQVPETAELTIQSFTGNRVMLSAAVIGLRTSAGVFSSSTENQQTVELIDF